MAENRPPQLRMLRHLEDLPPVAIPPGYQLQRFLPGDEQAWLTLLNMTNSLGEWSIERVQQLTNGPVRVFKPGIHFILDSNHKPAATACLTIHDDWQAQHLAEMGWVGAAPEHQGHGLGYQVCLATLHYIRQCGYTGAVLFTDDFRVPAIKTYLRLGFEPQYTHESHQERWQKLFSAIPWQKKSS